MNLTASIGFGAGISPVRREAPPVAVQRKRAAKFNETPTIELTLRFSAWAHELLNFPTPTQIQDHFGVHRATAYRWRHALAAAYGTLPPAIAAGTGQAGRT